MSPKANQNTNFPKPQISDRNDPSVAILLALVHKLRLTKLFDKHVKDPRQGRTTYPLAAILGIPCLNLLFLMGSKNSFHTQLEGHTESHETLLQFFGIDSLPVTKTIDDVLEGIDYEQLNDSLLELFDTVRKSKLFFEHDELIPEGHYNVAIDLVNIHTYHPGNAHLEAECPFCLKRQRGETIWYLHQVVVASIVCPGGLRLPLLVHPVHAKNLRCPPKCSDDTHKQECELSAFPIIIDRLRTRFPRLKICVLLDALYANGPVIDRLSENKLNYRIVRKAGNMPTVGEDCDGLLKIKDESHQLQTRQIDNKTGKIVSRSYTYFNHIDYHSRSISILRLDEKESGTDKRVHWEWIVANKITKSNAATIAENARLRWEEEDLFNTLEHRGMAMNHDYSRDPTAQMAWIALMMVATFITNLFIHMRAVAKIRKRISIRDFMKSLFYQLIHLTVEAILKARVFVARTQFRYCFTIRGP